MVRLSPLSPFVSPRSSVSLFHDASVRGQSRLQDFSPVYLRCHRFPNRAIQQTHTVDIRLYTNIRVLNYPFIYPPLLRRSGSDDFMIPNAGALPTHSLHTANAMQARQRLLELPGPQVHKPVEAQPVESALLLSLHGCCLGTRASFDDRLICSRIQLDSSAIAPSSPPRSFRKWYPGRGEEVFE